MHEEVLMLKKKNLTNLQGFDLHTAGVYCKPCLQPISCYYQRWLLVRPLKLQANFYIAYSFKTFRNETQSGFRPKHALIKFIDIWMECIGKGNIIGALFLNNFDKFTGF